MKILIYVFLFTFIQNFLEAIFTFFRQSASVKLNLG